MTKAASVSIGLVLLFTITTPSWAQRTPTAVAAEEALRRQNAVLELRGTLTEAQTAEAKGDFALAKTLYEECYQLVQGIGAAYNIEAETALTLSGLANSHLELARAAQKRGQLREANTHVSRVLVVSPTHPAALEFKATNDKLLAEKQPYLPSPEIVDRIPQMQQEKASANTLVQDAAVLLEAGKLQEAEAKLAEARRIDPDSRAAQYYSSLVKEKELRLAEARREQDSKKGIVDVVKDWARPAKRDTLPIPNPYARTNLTYTGKGRQTIVRKLDMIKMDTVMWDGLGLNEVVRNLSDEAKKRDPEKKGINFIVNPNAEVIAQPAFPTIDPTTGLPLQAPPPEVIDIASVSVKLNPGLTDVTLAEVLDAIVKVADKPIRYSIEDYAVVFSLKGPEPLALEIRNYKVDPNTFYQGLESVNAFAFDIQTSSGGGGGGGGGRGGGGGAGGAGGESILTVPRVNVSGGSGQTGGGGGVGGGGQQGGGLRFTTRTNNMEEVSIAVQNFFRTLGVNLDPALNKSVFWNDRSGILMVRATSEELDIIDSAIQILNVTPHQVNVKAKFVEITQEDNRALGFDWYLGNFLFGNKQVVGSGGSQPTLNGPPTVANPNGFFPGTSPGTAIPSAASDQLITSGLRNSYGLAATDIPTIATFTGILTDPQFRAVIKAIDTREGVDLLSSPEVTTVSGRQAQVQVVDLRTIVTGVQQNQGQQAGAVATGGGGNVTLPPAAVFQTPDTQLLPFGPILDVIPYISADGFTIQMTLIPSITEFVGYDDPGLFVPTTITSGGTPITSVLPLPRFRLRQVTTSAVVWDGQTIVLGGLLSEDVRRLKDKVPVLGDIPLVGRFFRSESSSTLKKNLVIFVTPTIVDPAGNRLHSEDEMPFRQTTIPPQEPIR